MAASTSSSDPGGQRNIRLVLEYDGTDLCGWQRQDNGPTVQGHLENCLAEMVGRPVQVIGASRTDAGVHARGQVANFATSSTIPVHGFRRGLNSSLPPAIAVVNCDEVDAEFNARFSALGKSYRYTLLNRKERSPLVSRTSWHRPTALDVESMCRASACLVGRHDFSAFRASGCTAHTAVREITTVEVSRSGDLITIDVAGQAFLRNMVRIIAGTLVDVGEGRMSPQDVAAALASGERERAGQTAPARGLTLMQVFYDR